MIDCRYCGTEIPKDAEVCLLCGRQRAVHSVSPALDQGNRSEYPPTFTLRETSTYRAFDPAPAVPSIGPTGISPSRSPALFLKRRNRLGLWIILGVTGLLLLVSVSAFVYLNRSTPAKTLQTACNASKSEDFETAYEQFSNAFKSKVGNEREFASGQQQFFDSRGGLFDCTATNVNQNSSMASATIVLKCGDGSIITDDVTLIEENGVWKILSATIRQ